MSDVRCQVNCQRSEIRGEVSTKDRGTRDDRFARTKEAWQTRGQQNRTESKSIGRARKKMSVGGQQKDREEDDRFARTKDACKKDIRYQQCQRWAKSIEHGAEESQVRGGDWLEERFA